MGLNAGVETRVNTETAGNQFEQRVVTLEDGGWLVSWRSSSGFGVTQRAYNSDGSSRGAATHVDVTQNHGVVSLQGGGWVYVTSEEAFYFDNEGAASSPRDVEAFSTSTFWDRATDFAWLSNGGWVGYGYIDGSVELGQNAYGYDGTAIVTEMQVNSTVDGNQSRPRYIGTEDGGWVVVWRSEYMAPEGPKYQAFSQAFNTDGTKRGGEVVAGTADGGLTGPYITQLNNGTFVTVWSERDAGSGLTSIHQLRLDANGLPIGTETTVSPSQASYDAEPRVTALHSGGWVVTWKGVVQQVFDENGLAIGGTTVAVQGANDGHEVVALDNGGWVVLHWSYGDIVQQVYSPTGSPIGEAQTVNTYTTYQQSNVDASSLSDGGWVVTWESENQDGSGTGVYQRVFHLSNSAPTVAHPIGDQTADEDQLFTFQVGSDAFADVDGEDGLSFAATLMDGSALPTWLTFDPVTRTFSGAPANAHVGAILVKLTATDTFGVSATDTFTVTVDNTNDAPTITDSIADQTATEDQSFAFEFDSSLFVDVDAGDSLTYLATLSDGSALPTWLSFNAETRTFSGIPSNGDVGEISVRVTAADSSGASVSDTFDIIVGNVNDSPTLAHSLADQSAVEDQAFDFQIASNIFADVDVDDTLTYVATLADGNQLPGWLSFNPLTRTFSGTPENDDVGLISITVVATDKLNATVSDTFDITVGTANDAPTLKHALPDRSATQGEVFNFEFAGNTFADIDAGDTLIYSATLANGNVLPSWLHFDASTRTFSGTPSNGDIGTISVKVTATDSSNASASDTFDVTVANVNDAPSDIGLSDNKVNENVKAGTVVGILSATDPDSGDVLAFSLTENPDNVFAIKNGKLVVAAGAHIDFEARQSYAVSVRATDSGGLYHDETFTISVTDVIDHVTGTNAANTLKGASGVDVTKGLAGNDTLYGYAGNDTLNGGKGFDKLYGGAGADTFTFTTGDSAKSRAAADTIFDFTKGDSIDLTGWDANPKVNGMQDFHFIGARAFGGHAGELHFVRQKSDTWIEGDTNGDRIADFIVHLDDAVALKLGNFDL